jgi:deoxyadenosine/deoxycytidine kinase
MIRTRDPAESRIVQELRDRKRLRQSANYQELTDKLVILSLYWPKLLEKVLQRELQVEIKKRAKRHNLKVAKKLKTKMDWQKLAGPRPALVH